MVIKFLGDLAIFRKLFRASDSSNIVMLSVLYYKLYVVRNIVNSLFTVTKMYSFYSRYKFHENIFNNISVFLQTSRVVGFTHNKVCSLNGSIFASLPL